MWSSHTLPMFMWVFSRDSDFLPHAKAVQVRWIGMSQLSQSEVSVDMCELPCDGRDSCLRAGSQDPEL